MEIANVNKMRVCRIAKSMIELAIANDMTNAELSFALAVIFKCNLLPGPDDMPAHMLDRAREAVIQTFFLTLQKVLAESFNLEELAAGDTH